MNQTEFGNPYQERIGKGVEGFKRITMEVTPDDYYLVKCIYPGLGCITGTLGTLWFKLCAKLRELNITDVSKQNEFRQLIAGCVILSNEEYQQLLSQRNGGGLPNSGIGGIVSEAVPPVDQRRVESPSQPNPEPQTVIPAVQGRGGEKRRTGRGKEKGTS